MTNQLEILFVHSHENNHDSKRHLEENRSRFSNQCRVLLDAFKRGERLTTMSALERYKIVRLAARVADLKDNGIQIDYEWIKDGSRTKYKEYFIQS